MEDAVDRPSTESPHYVGHRDRLRQRFLKAGSGALADYELLELVLFYVSPRGDTKPLAKELIRRFHGFNKVFQADAQALLAVPGVGPNTVLLLKTVSALLSRALQAEVMARPILSNWQALLDYCRVSQGYDRIETVRLLFLDAKNALIADEVQQTGTVNHTPLYPREVMKRALELGASALILVHNHPSGDPTPSPDDIELTKTLAKIGSSLGITLHDHLIVAEDRHVSLKAMGIF